MGSWGLTSNGIFFCKNEVKIWGYDLAEPSIPSIARTGERNFLQINATLTTTMTTLDATLEMVSGVQVFDWVVVPDMV
jgi:hypothetical protein